MAWAACWCRNTALRAWQNLETRGGTANRKALPAKSGWGRQFFQPPRTLLQNRPAAAIPPDGPSPAFGHAECGFELPAGIHRAADPCGRPKDRPRFPDTPDHAKDP